MDTAVRWPVQVNLLMSYSPGHDSGFYILYRWGRAKYVLIDMFGTFCMYINLT